MSFELIRIDDRMIHGQIVMTWIRYTRAQAVYLIDDKVARMKLLKKIMIMIAPTDVEVRILYYKRSDGGISGLEGVRKKIHHYYQNSSDANRPA